MSHRPKRLITAYASKVLSIDVQRLLWSLLDDFLAKASKADSLQIYRLTTKKHNGIKAQKVIHEQEVPPLIVDEDLFVVDKPYQGVIWIHLENDKQTMLFPEDW